MGDKMQIVKLDPKANARQEVVCMAESILHMAKNGELQDLTWCASRTDGGIHTGFTPTDDQMQRIASVARLLHRLNISADGSEIDE